MKLRGTILSLIEATNNSLEIEKYLEIFRKNQSKGFSLLIQEIKSSVSETIKHLLQAEITLFLNSNKQLSNRFNGYHPPRSYTIKGLGEIQVKVPKDRNGKFNSNIIPKYERIDPRLEADMAVLHLAGLSTRTLSMISKRLLGVKVNKDMVTSSLDVIKDEAEKWLERPLNEEFWALIIDGTFFSIQRKGSIQKEPMLVVLGIGKNNCKSLLSISSGTRDNVSCWKAVFKDLKERGLCGDSVKVGVMDGLPGLEKLFKEEFSNSSTSRCWRHAAENIMAKVPKRFEKAFKLMLDKVMYAESREDALEAFNELKTTMNKDGLRAVNCLEKNLESLLNHFNFDPGYRLTLRTTNSIERVNKELKRRYRAMGSIGESSLRVLMAFTSLRLQMAWQSRPVNSKAIQNLRNLNGPATTANAIERTIEELNISN